LKDQKTSPQAKRRGAAFALKISVEQAIMLHRFGIIPHLFTSIDWLFLRRRDIVSQAVSLAITQKERSAAAQGIRADAGLYYDFDQISRLVRAITLGNALIQQVLNIFECRYHVVEYEDIIEHPGRVVAGVLDGFGLKPARPRTASRQVTVIDSDIHAGFKARYLDDLRKSLLAT
jgi:LPS sulfotransferase NodH